MSFYDQNRPFGVREAQAAKESAARIEAAPKSIDRAFLDGLKAQLSKPAQRGWRQRVRFLNQCRRCSSYREAAGRIGVDESTVRRWRARFEGFRARCDEIVAERYREKAADLKLWAGEPRTRPYFFKGKQIGEQVIQDDRALMFLLKLEDAQRVRAGAREERREQRARELRLRELRLRELEIQKMHASAAHPPAPAAADSSVETNDLPAVAADIAPPEVVEVVPLDVAIASQAPLPQGGKGQEHGGDLA